MISRLKDLLGGTAAGRQKDPAFDDKQLAAAALLVEAAQQDADFGEREQRTILDLVEAHFELSSDEAIALLEAASDAQAESNQLLGFTRLVKDNFDEEGRIELIEMLWEVAYADGVLHPYEANLLRRVGGLIYVSDRDRGEARKRVLRRLGLDEGQSPN